jgi:glucose-1-phosphate thymidylyltransferase
MGSAGKNRRRHSEIIGLIPAAGQATRIAPLPCSKELYPIGFRTVPGSDGLRPKAVSHYLLEKMQIAGVRKAYFILRQGKWDIPAYWGDGEMLEWTLLTW